MHIAVGSDHAGYRLKEFFAAHIATSGHDIDGLGTHSEVSVDYHACAAAGAVHHRSTRRPGRAHNHAEVVGTRRHTVEFAVAEDAIDSFPSTAPGDGPHDRRIPEIAVLEAR
jgi:ribose 5-phosphate isomerase RpiB